MTLTTGMGETITVTNDDFAVQETSDALTSGITDVKTEGKSTEESIPNAATNSTMEITNDSERTSSDSVENQTTTEADMTSVLTSDGSSLSSIKEPNT